MSLTTDQVKKIAALSRIKMGDDEINKYCGELNKIFSWIEQLNEVNTDNIAPLTSIEQSSLASRPDEVTITNNLEALMESAPASKYGYFAVPKVIE
jgi:aspartyl-tRNA(Asn)/glutamyl-tRNA(Gln) amidotransferase subunit C